MKVLLAVVGDSGTCSLGFAVSMLRLQTALQSSPVPVQAMMEVVPSVRTALDIAAADKSIEAVVAIKNSLSFTPGFVLRALASKKDAVVGVYPLPRIDWDRVKARQSTSEKAEFRGNVYNIDASKATFAGNGYLELANGQSVVESGCVVLTRQAVDTLATPSTHKTTDEVLGAAWTKAVYADVDQQCSNFGPVEFFGCVGMRTVLR